MPAGGGDSLPRHTRTRYQYPLNKIEPILAPSDIDTMELTEYLGGEEVLKYLGYIDWDIYVLYNSSRTR